MTGTYITEYLQKLDDLRDRDNSELKAIARRGGPLRFLELFMCDSSLAECHAARDILYWKKE